MVDERFITLLAVHRLFVTARVPEHMIPSDSRHYNGFPNPGTHPGSPGMERGMRLSQKHHARRAGLLQEHNH
jgi:hypothetical protein